MTLANDATVHSDARGDDMDMGVVRIRVLNSNELRPFKPHSFHVPLSNLAPMTIGEVLAWRQRQAGVVNDSAQIRLELPG